MRLGGGIAKKYENPQEWIELVREMGYGSVYTPVSSKDPEGMKKEYIDFIRENGIPVGEVGVWVSPIQGGVKRKEAVDFCISQLALAEEMGANCCVNIAGSVGEVWDGPDERDYGKDVYSLIIDVTREIIDAVKPKRTFYTLECMPWMHPDSPEDYLQMLKDVDRAGFGIHLDYVNIINSPQRFLFRHEFLENCFKLLGPYIKSVHAKDIKMERGFPCVLRETMPGQGSMDFRRVVRLAESISPDLPVFTEHLNSWDDYVSAAECIRSAAKEEGITLKCI